MTKSPAQPKQDDPAQSQRFIEMAREVEADESPEAFERAFEKVVKPLAPLHRPSEKKGSPE